MMHFRDRRYTSATGDAGKEADSVSCDAGNKTDKDRKNETDKNSV